MQEILEAVQHLTQLIDDDTKGEKDPKGKGKGKGKKEEESGKKEEGKKEEGLKLNSPRGRGRSEKGEITWRIPEQR